MTNEIESLSTDMNARRTGSGPSPMLFAVGGLALLLAAYAHGRFGQFDERSDRLRRQGAAILFYSSDDEELLHLCDRVLVLHDGAVHAELAGPTLNRAELIAASVGASHASARQPAV